MLWDDDSLDVPFGDSLERLQQADWSALKYPSLWNFVFKTEVA